MRRQPTQIGLWGSLPAEQHGGSFPDFTENSKPSDLGYTLRLDEQRAFDAEPPIGLFLKSTLIGSGSLKRWRFWKVD